MLQGWEWERRGRGLCCQERRPGTPSEDGASAPRIWGWPWVCPWARNTVVLQQWSRCLRQALYPSEPSTHPGGGY